MRARERNYRCNVCRWEGPLEPIDAGDAAPCPRCGVFLYPLSWMQTWGVAIAIIGVTVAAIFAAAWMMA